MIQNACAIALVGIVNYFGPTKAGTGALIVAIITMLCSLAIAAFSAPSLPDARIAAAAGAPIDWWRQFTAIILAISGVEAIANMTGIMVEPVQRTSKLAIWRWNIASSSCVARNGFSPRSERNVRASARSNGVYVDKCID